MKMITYLLAGLLSSAIPAAAENIRIEHAASHSMIPGAKVGDGYLVIVNNGDQPDRLISASSPRAKTVQLHKMTMSNGIMSMRGAEDGLPIPAHSTVKLAPDYHLMFNDVSQPFRQGERIEATLTFEKAGAVTASFVVGKIAGPLEDNEPSSETMKMDGMDMQGMDMQTMHHQHQAPKEDPKDAIPQVLRTMFEAPEKPLTVGPVVADDEWAVAGWQQDGHGGRVLLRSSDQGWTVHALGGDTFMTAGALETAGAPAETAKRLAEQLSKAEAALKPDALKALGSFNGVVMLADSPAEAGHAHHDGH